MASPFMDEKTISEDEIVYPKGCDSSPMETASKSDVSPLLPSRRFIEHPQLSPVREELKVCRGIFPSAYQYDDFMPMVDKTVVDTTWNKAMQDEKLAFAKGCFDATKGHEGLSSQIFAGLMAFIMGIITMIRLTRNMPKRLTDANLYSSPMYCMDTMVKSQAPHQMPMANISGPEYYAIMKRMSELEDKVTVLSMKPAAMPVDKEELLNAAVTRVDALEQELMVTKKALDAALGRQNELLAYIDKKKKKKKLGKIFCWVK